MSGPSWLKEALERSKHPTILTAKQTIADDAARDALIESCRKYLENDHMWEVAKKFASSVFTQLDISHDTARGLPINGKGFSGHSPALCLREDQEFPSDYPPDPRPVGYTLTGFMEAIDTYITITLTLCADKSGNLYSVLFLCNDLLKYDHYSTTITPKTCHEVERWLVKTISGLIDGSLPVPLTAAEIQELENPKYYP